MIVGIQYLFVSLVRPEVNSAFSFAKQSEDDQVSDDLMANTGRPQKDATPPPQQEQPDDDQEEDAAQVENEEAIHERLHRKRHQQPNHHHRHRTISSRTLSNRALSKTDSVGSIITREQVQYGPMSKPEEVQVLYRSNVDPKPEASFSGLCLI